VEEAKHSSTVLQLLLLLESVQSDPSRNSDNDNQGQANGCHDSERNERVVEQAEDDHFMVKVLNWLVLNNHIKNSKYELRGSKQINRSEFAAANARRGT